MINFVKKCPLNQYHCFRFIIYLVKDYLNNKCSQIAASLTYTTLLSLVPILTVLLVIISSIPVLESAREQVYSHMYNNLMPESGIQVKQYLTSFAEKSVNLTTIGISVLLYTTMSTLLKIELAFNQIWNVSLYQDHQEGSARNIILNILITLFRYLFIICLVPIVLGVAFIFSSAVDGLNLLQKFNMDSMYLFEIKYLNINWSWLTSMGTIVWAKAISFLITMIGFTSMYWFIPKAKVKFRNASIAGFIIALLFEVVRFAFGWIVTKFTSYASVYGAFAVLPVLILWINLSWNLILLGVEISYCLNLSDEI